LDDLEYCIKEIKSGTIYDASTSELRQKLYEADKHFADVFDVFSDRTLTEQKADEEAAVRH